MWYKDIDSAYHYANAAFRTASFYGQGKAEACNNMALCNFMKMDFEQAEQMYNSTKRYTQNEPELLIADIGLMQICQRTAMNKEFYDHRNSALKRMKRIEEDKSLFYDLREKSRLSYAYTEFRLISAFYYYSLRQRQEALSEMACIDADEVKNGDAGQYMRYLYMRGLTGMDGSNGSNDERLLSEFDNMYKVYKMATDDGYTYMIGDGLLGISDKMATKDGYLLIVANRPGALSELGMEVDSLLPLHVGRMALKEYGNYKDLYGMAGAYVVISRYLNENGRYEEAFEELCKALECVNRHHESRYHSHNGAHDRLHPYEKDNKSHEMEWIGDEKTKTIPEWISAIREQLSVAYAGMEMKSESDYNRNIYLDILNNTRQDSELESRYAGLEEESHKLTIVLIAVIAAFVIMMSSLIFFNRRTKARGEAYTNKLREALALCNDITSGKSVDTANCDKDVQKLMQPFVEWAERNEQNSDMLTEEREQLEAKRYICERHIDEDKRQNIVRKSCLSLVYGITPYIDRMINEVDKLIGKGYLEKEQLKQEKFQYIGELADTINEQNEILSLWIKMRQGAIQLNVESFRLQDLFSLLQKGRRSFEIKNQTLRIDNTDSVVRADKALTLFMINTLMENARKYTPDNGDIHIYATDTDDYVEISVKDTGIGLSADDIDTILNSKVYDSKAIGTSDDKNRDYLTGNKGGGFGLMNCKGIIEKYRKTNRLFSVCTFGIESSRGEGSRFYFRLPVGIMKTLSALLVFIASLTSCGVRTANAGDDCSYASATDPTYSILLDSASLYADSVYYANVEREHEQALAYAEKALELINSHYLTYSGDQQKRLLKLVDDDTPAEFSWWSNDFDTDYHVILDIRNEAAVAFLALKHLDGYRYNNEAYAGMYKLQGKDTTIESYCHNLERSSVSKTIGVVICIVLLVLSVVSYYILFIRKRIVEVINLRQVLEVNRRAFAASQPCRTDEAEALQMEEDTLHDIPRRIVDDTFESLNDLLDIDTLGIAIFNELPAAHPVYVSSSAEGDADMPAVAERCHDEGTMITEESTLAIPLKVETDEERCIGVLHLEFSDKPISETKLLFAELVAKYYAIVIYNSVICPAVQYRDIESAHEEVHRASWEESMLHVQNMVLDNCLSTIKHETIYYPSRIKNILGGLMESQLTADEEKRQVEDISELVRYYRGVFAILYSCASRQLEEVTFRRTTIAVGDVTDYCQRYFNKRIRTLKADISLTVQSIAAAVTGDRISLQFLLENLIDEALSYAAPGQLELKATADGQYIRFHFTDLRRVKSSEELNKLFTPDLKRMTAGNNGELNGTEYLICKQIIREHDEYAGRRGCRINAEQHVGGGFTVYFTIPSASLRNVDGNS
jgi:signal transduction histidine kinase